MYYYGQEEFVEAETEAAEAEERASEEWFVSSPLHTAFTTAISFVSRFCSVATMLKTLR